MLPFSKSFMSVPSPPFGQTKEVTLHSDVF